MSMATIRSPQALQYLSVVGMSRDSQVVTEQWLKSEEHYWLPITRRPQGDAEKFQALAETWRREVQFLSSVTEMVLHPAYQRIIGMGTAVVPHLLCELERRPDHWFWALTAITGADPIKPEDRGKLRKMTEAWLRWGKEQGLTW
jgi:hypothetical protein